MEIFMKETGKMIKLLDMEPIFIRMGRNMKVSGRMTTNMERVFKLGSMVVNMMGIMLKARRVEKENTHGEMEAIM
jgi:hypothetical protein